MQWLVAEKNRQHIAISSLFLLSVSFMLSSMIVSPVGAQSTGGGTAIGVTICTDQPQITITQPASDSIVTDSTVTLEGTVSQASQIEIRIDDAFDSIIPLSIGQSSFSGPVTLPSGTHTIKATAVNVCPGPNESASVVVTYEAPPSSPSSGNNTDTAVSGTSSEGSVDSGSADSLQQPENASPGGGFIGGALDVIQDIAGWLNVNTGNDRTDNFSKMSVGQALTFTAGMSFVLIGLSPVILHPIATLPAFVNLFPSATPAIRLRILSWGGRIIGFGAVLASLFL